MATLSSLTSPARISPHNGHASASKGPVKCPPTASTSSSAKASFPVCQDAGIREEDSQSRRSLLWRCAVAAAAVIVDSGHVALADVKIALSNIQATSVPCPEGQTTVTGGTSFGARCFRITGDATNPVKQPVYNADIFGRVYDAQGEPALDVVENLRIDTIREIPPGSSKVSFQITVNEGQAKLGPLQLKNFKATGYLGKVNNQQGSGRLDDIDFSELDEDYVP